MIVFVEVMPKKGIHDPQGKAVQNALSQLGFEALNKVNIGKLVSLEIDTDSEDNAREMAAKMADKLLANPNVESYRVFFPERANS